MSPEEMEKRIIALEKTVASLQVQDGKKVKKPKVSRPATAYALFIKENINKVREQNPGKSQKEIFSLCAKLYQEQKAKA